MNDPQLNNLLKWGIQNSDASRSDPSTAPQPMTEVDKEALRQLIAGVGGPSDADLMRESFQVIENNEAEAEAKHQAFENFELLIQGIDNANNMEGLGLWTKLIKQLESEDPVIRMWAAWCCSTAVQNNVRSQERVCISSICIRSWNTANGLKLLVLKDAIPTLVRLATSDPDRAARKKATSALSSTVRNFQPGLDAVLEHMPAEYKPKEVLDANDMSSVDILINKLREST